MNDIPVSSQCLVVPEEFSFTCLVGKCTTGDKRRRETGRERQGEKLILFLSAATQAQVSVL